MVGGMRVAQPKAHHQEADVNNNKNKEASNASSDASAEEPDGKM